MSEESQGYFELLNAFRAASYQGTGTEFISAHPELTSIRSPHVGETVLHFVAIENEVQAVKELAAAGADAGCCDGSQTTPLMSSVKLGHFEMASLLLALGADVHARDHDGQTVLHHWCHRPKEAILELLLAAGADIHAVDELGETPLGETPLGETPLGETPLGVIYSSIAHQERHGPPPPMSA